MRAFHHSSACETTASDCRRGAPPRRLFARVRGVAELGQYSRVWLWLALLIVSVGFPAEAAAPISFDRDVVDLTPWLKPFNGVPGETNRPTSDDKRWLSLDLANPTGQEAHRIITLESSSKGIL